MLATNSKKKVKKKMVPSPSFKGAKKKKYERTQTVEIALHSDRTMHCEYTMFLPVTFPSLGDEDNVRKVM